VRSVRTLRIKLGTEHGTVKRVADQPGYGVESVRFWVRQADIDDGHEPGVSTAEAARVREFEGPSATSRSEPGGASRSGRRNRARAAGGGALDHEDQVATLVTAYELT
jgi:transposase-like protein